MVESPTGGAAGVGATSRSIIIDDGGTPVAGKYRTDAPLAPGTVAITITDSDVSNIRLVVRKQ
jgi:hypothetical protein